MLMIENLLSLLPNSLDVTCQLLRFDTLEKMVDRNVCG